MREVLFNLASRSGSGQYARMTSDSGTSDVVTIREQDDGDAARVYEVIHRAFGAGVVADLDAALARRVGGAAYVASTSKGLVSQVRLTWGWLDAPSRLVEVLVLSPLSVAPTWQRRGIGRKLVERAVVGAMALAAPLLFLEGDPAYYSSCGFEPAVQHGFARPSVRIPEPAFQVMRLRRYETWMTGALINPEIFWEFDCVGLRTEPPG
jgi:putative acetyltransferase